MLRRKRIERKNSKVRIAALAVAAVVMVLGIFGALQCYDIGDTVAFFGVVGCTGVIAVVVLGASEYIINNR